MAKICFKSPCAALLIVGGLVDCLGDVLVPRSTPCSTSTAAATTSSEQVEGRHRLRRAHHHHQGHHQGQHHHCRTGQVLDKIYLFLSIVEVRKLAQTDTWWLLVALIDVGHFRKQKG